MSKTCINTKTRIQLGQIQALQRKAKKKRKIENLSDVMYLCDVS